MTEVGERDLWPLLGLSDFDVLLYRYLLHEPGAGVADCAAALDCSRARIRTGVDRLVQLGLVNREDRTTSPVRPSIALRALARERRRVLGRTEEWAKDLDEIYAAGDAHSNRSGPMEVVRSAGEILTRLEELVAGARSSIDSVDTPPYVGPPSRALHDAETTAIASGVAMRSLVDHSALDSPPHVEDILRSVGEGQQVRLSGRAHHKMVIIDRRTVVVPIAIKLSYGEAHAAVISHREIVEAMSTLFDLQFETAVPFDPITAAPAAVRDSPWSVGDRALAQLLAGGMSDTAIARQLDISDRTLRRRMASLEERLGANSRFQLGQLIERHRTEFGLGT